MDKLPGGQSLTNQQITHNTTGRKGQYKNKNQTNTEKPRNLLRGFYTPLKYLRGSQNKRPPKS
jgi:hypothetical protein